MAATTSTLIDGTGTGISGTSNGVGTASRRKNKHYETSSASSPYHFASEKEDDDDDDDSDNESDMSFESDDSDVQVIKEPLVPKWVSWTGLVTNTTLLWSQARHLGIPEGQAAPPLDGPRIATILSQVNNHYLVNACYDVPYSDLIILLLLLLLLLLLFWKGSVIVAKHMGTFSVQSLTWALEMTGTGRLYNTSLHHASHDNLQYTTSYIYQNPMGRN